VIDHHPHPLADPRRMASPTLELDVKWRNAGFERQFGGKLGSCQPFVMVDLNRCQGSAI
jgi:hypothetical protein